MHTMQTQGHPFFQIAPLFVLLTCLCACGDGDGQAQAPTSAPDSGLPDQGGGDASQPTTPDDVFEGDDAAPGEDGELTDDGSTPTPLEASQYCEAIVDFFCPYYVRCGRMGGVTEVARCQEIFIETCNAVYEPYYVALEARGALRLSAEGIAACQAHLGEVACEAQPSDLDGPCKDMWEGLGAQDSPCGPGIESLICAQGLTCRLSVDFCGSCVPAGEPGQACAEGQECVAGAACVADTCVARQPPGSPCSEARPCYLGAGCVEGVCQGYDVVRLGDACDRANRCPYKSECVGGRCVETALQGEACTAAGCASGFCVEGLCAAPAQAGDPCQDNAQCLSRVCAQGRCASTISACLSE